ncbi:WXG100-like domain-containing protein [Saccharothrix luteola]|uniref:WXG100-like domain-containing protein n=1 Tax=Saccharothrix luteola TaxID=2893018 RepID=UPI001E5CBE7B|nr:alpha/beta hydrolase [Saccharothrix luteola]MCC8249421.1 alpha/beta hydrolase family protein [Saccharothrix luteola]
MAIPEPTAELWARAKAMGATWPLSNEETAHALADSWRRTGAEYGKAAEHSLNSVNADWPDAAGAVFTGMVRHHLQRAGTTAADMAELARRAEIFGTEVATAKDAIVKLLDANAERYADITGIGEDLQRNAFAQQLAAEATKLVAEAAGRITGGPPVGQTPGPPPGATPQEVHTWWLSLGQGERDEVVRNNPDLVRNLDGIPAEIRDQANRAVLDREITALRAERDRLADELNRNPGLWEQEHERLTQLNDQIATLERFRPGGDLAGADPENKANRYYLLGLDTAADGKIIVSYGNPDTARNIATYVPGTLAELDQVGGDIDRARRMALSAGEGTAVIAWVGYDAPDNIFPAAASPIYADNAEQALDRFQDGLRATDTGERAHLTVVGHSYGTTVVGQTARDHGLNADDVILVSSPGAGTQHVSELRLDGIDPSQAGQHVHATTAPGDLIGLANPEFPEENPNIFENRPPSHDPFHGRDPANPDFGARVFDSPPDWVGADGVRPNPHSAPLEQGHPAIDEIGAIIAGER